MLRRDIIKALCQRWAQGDSDNAPDRGTDDVLASNVPIIPFGGEAGIRERRDCVDDATRQWRLA